MDVGFSVISAVDSWKVVRRATKWTKKWWAGTRLNRRHQDFQSYLPVRATARNRLMCKQRVTTASCAGVCWNDQEYA